MFNVVASVWVFWVWQQHHESLTQNLTAAAAWIVFRTVSNFFSLVSRELLENNFCSIYLDDVEWGRELMLLFHFRPSVREIESTNL